MLKEAIIFVSGVAIGGAVTYFVVDKKLDEKYNKLAESEIAEVKERYNKNEIDDGNDDDEESIDISEDDSKVILYDAGTPVVSYNTVSSVKEIDKGMRKEVIEEFVPHILSPEEIIEAQEDEEMDIVCVNYYVKDNYVVENGLALDEYDIRSTIGFENLDYLKNSDEEVIYTRSKFGDVYEVSRYDDYWR